MELCRLCHLKMYPNFYKNLFGRTTDELDILVIIKTLTGLELNENDPFPKRICCGCFERLTSFYHFRQLVIKADRRYHEEFNIHQPNIEEVNVGSKPNIVEESLENVDVKDELNENHGQSKVGGDSNEIQVVKVHKKVTKHKPTLMRLLDDAKTSEIANLPVLCEIKSEDAININTENQTQETNKTPDSLNKCSDCGSTTTQASGFCIDCEKKKALNLFHDQSDLEDRKCNRCDKVFVSLNNLKRHLKTVHGGLKLYLCNICGQSFAVNDTLKRHLKTHTDEKTHQCNYCGKCFLTKGYLNKHLNVHQTENLFACHICDRSFKQKTNLNIHLNVHLDKKRYHCLICNKQFSHKSNLNTHIRVHNGDKRFKCEYCGKRFLVKCNLKRHLEVHNK